MIKRCEKRKVKKKIHKRSQIKIKLKILTPANRTSATALSRPPILGLNTLRTLRNLRRLTKSQNMSNLCPITMRKKSHRQYSQMRSIWERKFITKQFKLKNKSTRNEHRKMKMCPHRTLHTPRAMIFGRKRRMTQILQTKNRLFSMTFSSDSCR